MFFSLDFLLRGFGKQKWRFVGNVITRLQASKLTFRDRVKKISLVGRLNVKCLKMAISFNIPYLVVWES